MESLYTVRSIVEEDKDKKYKSHLCMARGGKVFRFTSGPKNDTSPRWSPKGDRIAFMSERGKDRTQLFLISADGGEAVQLTNRKEGVGEPVWSPDGKKIAFSALETDPEAGGENAGKDKSDVRVITRIRYKLNGRGFLPTARLCGPGRRVGGDKADYLRGVRLSSWWSPDGRDSLHGPV